MTISELGKSFGLKPSTLRFYERLGLLAPAGRVSGRRMYDKSAENRLAFIQSASESGFTLAEIKGLISASTNGTPPKRLWPNAVEAKRRCLDKEIERLTAARASLELKAACRCQTLKECEGKLARELRRSKNRTGGFPKRRRG